MRKGFIKRLFQMFLVGVKLRLLSDNITQSHTGKTARLQMSRFRRFETSGVLRYFSSSSSPASSNHSHHFRKHSFNLKHGKPTFKLKCFSKS